MNLRLSKALKQSRTGNNRTFYISQGNKNHALGQIFQCCCNYNCSKLLSIPVLFKHFYGRKACFWPF